MSGHGFNGIQGVPHTAQARASCGHHLLVGGVLVEHLALGVMLRRVKAKGPDAVAVAALDTPGQDAAIDESWQQGEVRAALAGIVDLNCQDILSGQKQIVVGHHIEQFNALCHLVALFGGLIVGRGGAPAFHVLTSRNLLAVEIGHKAVVIGDLQEQPGHVRRILDVEGPSGIHRRIVVSHVTQDRGVVAISVAQACRPCVPLSGIEASRAPGRIGFRLPLEKTP